MINLLKRHGQKLILLLFWGGLAGGFWLYARQTSLTPLEVVQELIRLASDSVWGPVIYVGAYAIRPLLLFPSALLSVAAGYIFGPVWGVVYAVLGSNASASVDYFLAYTFGQGVLENGSGLFNRYTERLRNNSFETVLIMRLLFLPYDSVSLLVGFLRIGWLGFALATLLGGLPGSLAFVLFGASIEGEFGGGTPSLQPWTLAMAVALFVLSLGLSRYLRYREQRRTAPTFPT